MDESREVRIKRLRMLARHRGMLEVALLLEPFLRPGELEAMSDEALTAFERLLGIDDLDLWDMVTGRRPPAPEVDPELLAHLRHGLKRMRSQEG
jgi:succinate dehydrogenase flavin-adding protein (antitoxin of CptAB toxin-antitoxin module)